MKIDRNILENVAHLARLEFDEKGERKMIKDMTETLNWIEKLKELDTDQVEPLINMSHETNSFREDEVKEHLPHDKGMLNAPKKDSDYFRVPKVIGGDG